jgi:hypothetical protein
MKDSWKLVQSSKEDSGLVQVPFHGSVAQAAVPHQLRPKLLRLEM